MWFPVWRRIILSTLSLFGWKITNICVKTAILHIRKAARDMHMIPSLKNDDRGKSFWILLNSAYGLLNAIAKCKIQSNKLLTDLGYCWAPFLPQLLYLVNNSSVVAILSKILDELLLSTTPFHYSMKRWPTVSPSRSSFDSFYGIWMPK